MYKFGRRSEKSLEGVHEDLVAVVRLALQYTTVDFAVIEGLRTTERQLKLVRSGASKTMDSRHITGHAVDLVPYIDGRISWDWTPIYQVAEAMRQAATQLGVTIVWGAAWHTYLTDAQCSARQLSNNYVDLRRSKGKTPFMDGPHFQLARDHYPA